MLVIGRPPHRSDRLLFTSLADSGLPAALGGDCGIGVGRICDRSGGGSVNDAICGAGGLGTGVNGTGARRASIITGAVDFAPSGISGRGLGVTSSLDLEGGTKMAALAVPVTATTAKASARRFMEAIPGCLFD
jgi:hypothetical protein